MSDITVTAAQVSPLDPLKANISTYIANAALTKGDAIYLTTAGKADKCDADASGKYQYRGIALQTVGAGDPVDVIDDGLVAGFDVTALNADALVYVSNNAGKLATAAGTTSIVAGRVVCLTDKPTLTKVLRTFVRLEADWS